ncbi:MAG: methylated-DNA--[protein]-cysteine S-methyltransferase [Acidobacteria bacterium]|nr:methylated-DNA--[protein]-cysteine S-methyltransferase [Acidobacteriota bacterium]MCL5289079.1 methylated-DNA--[protein]-cysteine S-methyltransferase [Acidobacteriota bacterium]
MWQKKVEATGPAAARVRTPIGMLGVAATSRGLWRIEFDARRVRPARGDAHARAHLAAAVKQLREYFSGQRKKFDVPLDLEGTPHQLRIWEALCGIPYGATLTYGELARRVGLPTAAARAAGRACATNPIPVVVPCHRVIGGDGKLHGFGGGLPLKEALLELEGSAAVRQGSLFKGRAK